MEMNRYMYAPLDIPSKAKNELEPELETHPSKFEFEKKGKAQYKIKTMDTMNNAIQIVR